MGAGGIGVDARIFGPGVLPASTPVAEMLRTGAYWLGQLGRRAPRR